MNLESKEVVEKNFKMNVLMMAQDHAYINDLTDESLANLYKMVHADFDKSYRKASDPSNLEALKSEMVLKQEYLLRGTTPPILDDKLTHLFKDIYRHGFVGKQDERTFEAQTTPDIRDSHVHDIHGLSQNGDGATESAGDPPHTHNVSSFLTMPVRIDSYESEHPGKVKLLTSKSEFKVTKRNDDGSMEWEANFDIFKIQEDQHLVGGIVYEPEVIDAQGDSASEDEIVKACHNFMIKSMTTGVMHERKIEKQDATIVENYIAPVSFTLGSQFVRKGSWVMVHKIFSMDLWKDIKEGKYTGYSMAGRAKDISRNPVFGKKDTTKPKVRKLRNIWLTKKQVRKLCAGCADVMDSRKISKIRIDTLLNSAKFVAQFGFGAQKIGYKGLCRRFGKDPVAFMTHCVDVIQDTDVDDPKSFCEQLKELCMGYGPEAIFLEEIIDKPIEDQNTTLIDGKTVPASTTMKTQLQMTMTGISKMLNKSYDLEKILRHEGSQWCVYSSDGSRKLGCHDTKEDALRQLAAIEANKHLTEKHLVETKISKEQKNKVTKKRRTQNGSPCRH